MATLKRRMPSTWLIGSTTKAYIFKLALLAIPRRLTSQPFSVQCERGKGTSTVYGLGQPRIKQCEADEEASRDEGEGLRRARAEVHPS